MEYKPAIPFIVNSLQNTSKTMKQAITFAHTYLQEDLSVKILQDLEKSSGNAEKVILEYLQKDVDSRYLIVPLVNLLQEKSPKTIVYVDLLKNYGDKRVSDCFIELLQNNQLEEVENYLSTLKQFTELSKLVEKVEANIPN